MTSITYSQKRGNLTGSFESINEYYESDSKTGAKAPKDKYGSNSYFNLGYNYKYFSAGLRYEVYTPALQGTPAYYNDSDIVHKYITFQKGGLNITVGNFYEQFGSGLLFRAYEERQLNIDNSVEGAKINYALTDFIRLKAIYGKQRNGFDKSKGKVRGAYSELNINKLFKLEETNLFKLEGGTLNKFEDYTGPEEDFPTSVDAFSGRFIYEGEFANFNVEYVTKSDDRIAGTKKLEGNAIYSNLSFFRKGLSFNASFRRVENMEFRSERMATENSLMINYIPSLTKQFGYSLSNIYVHAAQVNSEIGYQLDLFYKIHRKSILGGKYGTQIAINYSSYNNLKKKSDSDDTELFTFGDDNYYSDFNIEITKKWNKKLKTIFLYNYKEYNKKLLEGGGELVKPHIAVADIQYKIFRGKSVRVELQHLWAKNDLKDWMSGQIEFNVAPKWSVFAADDYNYGNSEKIHYYNFGGSFTKGSTRIAISYGRRRGGLNCVGGVCRYVPPIKGFSLSLVSKF